jgi:hypothetical protein
MGTDNLGGKNIILPLFRKIASRSLRFYLSQLGELNPQLNYHDAARIIHCGARGTDFDSLW